MAEHKYQGPECVYGRPCFAICTNPNCRKPGMICEAGFYSKDECSLFHESCSKVRWEEVESLIYDNPNLRSQEFHYLRDKMDSMFLNLISKVKAEHSKFRLWVKTYGFGVEVMKFIKNLTENSFSQISGHYMSPILTEMYSAKNIEFPKILENEVASFQEEIAQILEQTSNLYLQPGAYKEKSTSPSIIAEVKPKQALLSSKIVSDIANIQRLFDAKIASLELKFRATENAFSIKEFHKKCDGQTGTLVLLETEFGKVIGGYTPIAWSSAKKQWAADKSLKSFIFSLNMREKFNLNLAQFAIANNPDKGPIFGCCDICIVDNSHKERSNAEFPISYNNGKYIRSPESSFAFTGHPKGQFLVKEWEVFKIEFE